MNLNFTLPLRWLGLCAALALCAGSAGADVVTTYATVVPETSATTSATPWANEAHATLAPTCDNCNTTSCQYATNSTNGNTTPLSATDFANFVLPANHRIVRVQVDVSCRHNENTTATVGFRAFAPNHGLDTGWRNSPSFNSIAVGGAYVCAYRLGAGGDITALDANWTAAKVNDLQLQVRRQAGLTNNTLRVLAMKVVVTTEAAPSTPNTPTDLRATAKTATSVSLAWNDNASNETAHVLYQLDPGLDPSVPANWRTFNLPANTTTHARTGLAAGSTYRFQVRAANSVGFSAPSNTLVVATTTPPTGSQFFINEFRMTGGGSSYIEVAAPAGTVLDSSYRVLLINLNGTLGDTRFFGGPGTYPTVQDMGGGMGVARIHTSLIAGTRRGFAFVRVLGAQTQVLEFVTYRGGSSNAGPITYQFPGIGGVAGPVLPHVLTGGMNTLKLVGSGCHRGYFQWMPDTTPAGDLGTPGAVNLGQSFTSCP